MQTRQLLALERRSGRSGKDSLGHPAGGHDDRANALAVAAYAASKENQHRMVMGVLGSIRPKTGDEELLAALRREGQQRGPFPY